MRLRRNAYPGPGREVYYAYGSGGTDPTSNRVGRIAEDASGTTKYAQYTYLGAGTVVKAAHPAVTNGLELTYGTGGTYGGFDPFGRIVDHKWQNTATAAFDHFAYAYDRAGNRLRRENKHTSGGTFSELYHANVPTSGQEYDGLNRLIEFRRGTLNAQQDGIASDPKGAQQFTLEALGNWGGFKDDATDGSQWDLDQTRTHNEANEITDISGDWKDPVYDKAGNMKTGPSPLAPTTWRHFIYDAWNRLRKVHEDNGSTPGELDPGDMLRCQYEYDGLGRRIKRTDSGVAYDFYYNTSWQALEVHKGGDSDHPYEQLVWCIRYIDAPVLRFWDENTDGEDIEKHYYCSDANMNVTALLTDSGTVLERYVYDPYGRATIYNSDWTSTITWDNSKKNEVLYCGYRYDEKTGLYHVRHRYYHPPLGRWMQRDPDGYKDGMSIYQYVGSEPIHYADPSGLWGEDIHHDMTLAMANAAGLACPEDAAEYCLKPDKFIDSRPGPLGGMDVGLALLSGPLGPVLAQWKIDKIAEWHFPVDPDGVVRPNSDASRAKMKAALEECDFYGYFMGLHVLQDSWSHQGKPWVNGVMHARGGKKLADGTYVSTNGTMEAAFSDSTDKAELWPEDARTVSEHTYLAIVKFIETCPCHCPPKGWKFWAKRSTKAREPNVGEKDAWIRKQPWGDPAKENQLTNPEEVANPPKGP